MNNFICKECGKELDTSKSAYYCEECGYEACDSCCSEIGLDIYWDVCFKCGMKYE